MDVFAADLTEMQMKIVEFIVQRGRITNRDVQDLRPRRVERT